MGTFSGLIGTGGGELGTGVPGPRNANTQMPMTGAQYQNAQAGATSALGSQQNLLAALQAQGGLNAQTQALQGYQNLANGTGPNPAMAQLAQTTGQNVASQAALQAGQRGASSNVGLMARQAGQQGAATQQQAVGQAATLGAEQQLAGLQGQAGMANQMAGQQIAGTTANTQANLTQQQQMQQALQGYNAAQVGMQSNMNNVQGQLANTQLQGQQGMIGGAMQGIGSMMSMPGGGGGGGGGGGMTGGMTDPSGGLAKGGKVQRFDDGGDVPSEPTPTFGSDPAAASLAKGAADAPGSSSSSGGGSSGSSGGSSMMSMLPMLAMMASQGGKVQRFDDGGMAQGQPNLGVNTNITGPQSSFGQFLNGWQQPQQQTATKKPAAAQSQPTTGSSALFQGMSALVGGGLNASGMTNQQPQQQPQPQSQAKGGMVDIVVSPGEKKVSPENAKRAAAGGELKAQTIPGKAKEKGDSYENDTVKMKAKPGTVIIKRTRANNDPKGFVRDVLAKRGRK